MKFKLINVGIADIGVSREPDIIRTILGSCIGICLYDTVKKVGGIAHIMLPVFNEKSTSKKKYADTAIPLLLEELEKIGAEKKNITAKIVGGARMFKFSENSKMGMIGINNAEKSREVLKNMNIKIVSEDTGGDSGRTIDFYLETGKVKIKSLDKPEKII